MGFDNECIVNIQSLAGEYFCPVCRLLVYPNEALQTQCTHLYCKPCLKYVVSTTPACPYDGYLVTEADAKPLQESNKALADTIGKIQVHCLYHRSGCTWQGPLSECTSHCSGCAFGNSPVVCNRCGVQIVHRQVQEHAQTCSGVQTQAQAGASQDVAAAGKTAASNQNQSATQAGGPATLAQASQASATPASSQDFNQQANPVTQTQTAQATMPTPEQWYQQQQQYQQYYQQYPGYDPYQQYQQYYPYQQQTVQQYPQQTVQGYPPQVPGQPVAQAYGQPQAQAPLQSQQQVQPQAHPLPQQPVQGAPAAQSQPYPQAQAAVNPQQQVLPAGQSQPPTQVQTQGPYPQSQAYPQSQPFGQVQPTQPVAQAHVQVSQHQQTHPQIQPPHSQVLPQSYAPSQPQNYLNPQSQPQVQVQPPTHPNSQLPVPPPSQANQPMNPGAQPQAQHAPTHNVTGYQSYPQPQLHQQTQVGGPHPMNTAGPRQQPQYPGQMPGPYPQQPAQIFPPQSHAVMPNQQQPAMLSSQGQPPSGPPMQQLPTYPHTQHPGYPVPQRPGLQSVQQPAAQQYVQPQSFPGQGPFVQQHPTTQAQLRAQGPAQVNQQSQQNFAPGHHMQPNVAQNHIIRPTIPHGPGSQPYSQVGGTGAGQVRPMQLAANQASVNQTYPLHGNNQLPAQAEQQAAYAKQSLASASSGQLTDQVPNRVDRQGNSKEVARGYATASDDIAKTKSVDGMDEQKSVDGHDKARGFSTKEVSGSKQGAATDSGSLVMQNGVAVDENKPRVKEETAEGVSELASGNIKAKSTTEHHKEGKKQAGVLDSQQSEKATGGRSQMLHMHSGSLPQQRLAATSIPLPHSGPLQHGAFPGHAPNQIRPQGPVPTPPGQPFNAAERPQAPILKQSPTTFLPENPSGGILGSGSAASMGGGPSNLGPFPGHVPPYHTGQPQGEPFGAQPPAVRPHAAFDSHGGIMGKMPIYGPDAGNQLRPPYPMEAEMLPHQRPGYVESRHPDSYIHGYGPPPPGLQSNAMKFGGPSVHDPLSAPGLRDERFKPFPDEHMKCFPGERGHPREFEDPVKFPRPSDVDAGPSARFGGRVPSPRAFEQGSHAFGADGMSRHFDRESGSKLDSGMGGMPSRYLPPFHPSEVGDRSRPVGFHDDSARRGDFSRPRPDFPGPVPGLGPHQMDGPAPISPGRDYAKFSSRPFRAGGNIDGEGSKPVDFPADPFGKSIHSTRFPAPPSHLRRGELDGPGSLHMADYLNRDHHGPRNLHSGDGTGFGGHARMGEPHLGGNDVSFGESFGGDKHGHPRPGEPGFRSSYTLQRYGRDDGFYSGEMEPFDSFRKRKPGSIMCRICKVDCETVEGLDLHSQTREHQKKSMDLVLHIKQQNVKRLKSSKNHFSAEDGSKTKNASFEGRGNRR